MIPEISDTCVCFSTANDIWDALKQTYSKESNVAQVYEIRLKAISAKQGNRSITEYVNELKGLWQELDHYRNITTMCPNDVATFKKLIEQDRVYDFLVGINNDFDQARIQILGKEKLPTLNKVMSIYLLKKVGGKYCLNNLSMGQQ